jgi:hypothetical protein
MTWLVNVLLALAIINFVWLIVTTMSEHYGSSAYGYPIALAFMLTVFPLVLIRSFVLK